MPSATPTRTALSAILVLGASACATTAGNHAQLSDEESVIQQAMADAMQPASPEQIALAERSDPLTRANFWADEYRKDAANLETTVYFLKALRNLGSHDRVLEIAGKSLPVHPDSHEIYVEVGRSLLAQNKPSEASEAYAIAAQLTDNGEAAPLAGLGLALDRLGEHEKAQDTYQMALDLAPQRISTLNNYGLSLALTGYIDTAETVLRYAVSLPDASARVRQNLALILGIQGKYSEMEAVDPGAPRRTLEANRKALQKMMAPAPNYEDLQAYSAESVLDDFKAQSQTMPEIRHADVKEETLPEPSGKLVTDTTEIAPSKPISGPLRLKPRLRDSTGG